MSEIPFLGPQETDLAVSECSKSARALATRFALKTRKKM